MFGEISPSNFKVIFLINNSFIITGDTVYQQTVFKAVFCEGKSAVETQQLNTKLHAK